MVVTGRGVVAALLIVLASTRATEVDPTCLCPTAPGNYNGANVAYSLCVSPSEFAPVGNQLHSVDPIESSGLSDKSSCQDSDTDNSWADISCGSLATFAFFSNDNCAQWVAGIESIGNSCCGGEVYQDADCMCATGPSDLSATAGYYCLDANGAEVGNTLSTTCSGACVDNNINTETACTGAGHTWHTVDCATYKTYLDPALTGAQCSTSRIVVESQGLTCCASQNSQEPGLHLSSENAKIMFGANGECYIELRSDGKLHSNCDIEHVPQ